MQYGKVRSPSPAAASSAPHHVVAMTLSIARVMGFRKETHTPVRVSLSLCLRDSRNKVLSHLEAPRTVLATLYAFITCSLNEQADGPMEVGRGYTRSSVQEETRWKMIEILSVSSVHGLVHSMSTCEARSVLNPRQPGHQEWEERRLGPWALCAPRVGSSPERQSPPHTSSTQLLTPSLWHLILLETP